MDSVAIATGPAGPIASCQASRLASLGVEYPADRRRVSRGNIGRPGPRPGEPRWTPVAAGSTSSDGSISRALDGTVSLLTRRRPIAESTATGMAGRRPARAKGPCLPWAQAGSVKASSRALRHCSGP